MLEINQTISPDDHMNVANLEAYMRTCRSALDAIYNGLEASGRRPESINTVLDFGCGYGRIYRGLAAAFPNAELTACDLMESAAQFCADTFGGTSIKSCEDVGRVTLPTKYDLVWLGSVFTHLPKHRWISLLAFLAQWTNPSGVIVFTSHGNKAIKHMDNHVLKRNPYMIPTDIWRSIKQNLPLKGFQFFAIRAGNQKANMARGIETSEGEYGFSFATEDWVKHLLSDNPDWDLVTYASGGWGNNHDVVTLLRRVP